MSFVTTADASSKWRDPALDGLRGVAVLLVFFFHYGGGLHSPRTSLKIFGFCTQAGWTGVEVFFVLSGFLITSLFWDKRHRSGALLEFYGRRTRRILPLYLAALGAAMVSATVMGRFTPGALASLLVYLGFLQNLPHLIGIALRFPGPLPMFHFWTMAVEVQFYALWPLLLRKLPSRRRALWVCLTCFAVSFLFRLLVSASWSPLDRRELEWPPFLLSRLGALALGSAVALLSPAQRKVAVERWAWPCLVALASIFVAVEWSQGDPRLGDTQFRFALPAAELACATLLGMALEPTIWRSAFSVTPLRWLGSISYGFYIFHILLQPLYDHLAMVLSHAHAGFAYLALRLVVAFALSALVAQLSFLYLEQPLARKRSKPHQLPVAPYLSVTEGF